MTLKELYKTADYKDSHGMLFHGDCLELMKDIPDESVDMILTDPPYGTTACKWDNVISFEPMWKQLNRIIKKNGVIILFGSQPFTSKLICSNIENFREELIWLKNKAGSGLQANQKHIKIHENILLFCNQSAYKYNPQKWLVDKKEFLTQRKTFKDNEYIGNTIYGATTRTRKPDDGTRNPISILSCRTPHNASKTKNYNDSTEIKLHPTQKPISLLEYLIRTYTDEGDTVLDFTMGSGSTGVAALNLNRKFIGIELEKGYFDVALSRIMEAEKAKGNDS